MINWLLGLTKLRNRVTHLELETCHCCKRCISMIDAVNRRLAALEEQIREQNDSLANRP